MCRLLIGGSIFVVGVASDCELSAGCEAKAVPLDACGIMS